MIPVVWLHEHPLCWDQALTDSILSGRTWATFPTTTHHIDYEASGRAMADAYGDGAVVVVPARYVTSDQVKALIDPLSWAVVILTSDEEATFPWRDLSHPNMRIWVQTPRPEIHGDHGRFIPLGAPPDTADLLAEAPTTRTLDWVFAGQVNHGIRRYCVEWLNQIPGGEALVSGGFTQGLPRDEYLATLASARTAPAPCGPATPETFRVWEALEAGAVPLADDQCLVGLHGYWQYAFGEVPFPTISDWADAPKTIDTVLDGWQRTANLCNAWWQTTKRNLAMRIADDIHELAGTRPETRSARDRVTVLLPTSPIPSQPDTLIIEETVLSIRAHLDAEIIIMIDGVRDEQAHYRDAYDEYVARILHLAAHTWTGVTPLLFDEHHHQAAMTRHALDLVRTPTVMFVEHDTPLAPEPIDWDAILGVLEDGALHLVRFHHEAQIPEPHQYLMLDPTPVGMGGVPVVRTIQWSQRPHAAQTSYYRRILGDYFPAGDRTMIEPRMHSICQSEPWGAHRLGIYAPGPMIKRSLHLDGRAGDPKWEAG